VRGVQAQPSSYHNACTEALEQTGANPLDLEQILEPVEWAVTVPVAHDPAGEHGTNPGQRLEIARLRTVQVDPGVCSPQGEHVVGDGDAFTVTEESRLVHSGGIRGRRKAAGRVDSIRRPRSRWDPIEARPDHGPVNLNNQLGLGRLLEDANGGRGTARDEQGGAACDDRGGGDEDDQLLGAGPPQALRLRPPTDPHYNTQPPPPRAKGVASDDSDRASGGDHFPDPEEDDRAKRADQN